MFLICSISDSPGRRTTMADALMFYTNPMSRGQIVRWMLEEVGAPYEPRLLDYGTTMKAGDYLAINPMGKVPAIVHDGKAVKIGSAHVCTPVTNAPLVCRLLLENTHLESDISP